MADSNDTPHGDASRQRTPRALRLPKVNFEKVRTIVEGSMQMSGSASAAVIADQIGRAAKGQAWTDRWSTVRYLGFITKTAEGKYDISDLGRRFLSEDEEDRARAAQEALMRTSFGPLIKRFGTGSPNIKAMTNLFITDYNVPETTSGKAAELLVEMSSECRLVVDGRFKPAEIERAQEAAGDDAAAPPVAGGGNSRSGSQAVAKPGTPSPVVKPKPVTVAPAPAATRASSASASTGGDATSVPFGLSPTVVLNVDATKLTAAEIAEIVRELRKPAASS